MIPNLEAYVQLTLTDTATKEVVACIQVTVSNGLTTRLTSVQWTIGGVAAGVTIFVIVASVWAALRARRRNVNEELGVREKVADKELPPIPLHVDDDSASFSEDDQHTRVTSRANSLDILSPYPPLAPPIPSSSGHTGISPRPTPFDIPPRPASPPETLLAEPNPTPQPPLAHRPPSPLPLPTGSAPRRLQHLLTEYILFIQHIVLTGILHLNYPLAYSAFVQNFFWAFGLFGFTQPEKGTPVSFDTQGLDADFEAEPRLAGSGFQDAIDRLRARTGAGSYQSVVSGSDQMDVGRWRALDPVLYGHRTLSPYNEVAASSSAGSSSDSGSGLGGLFPVVEVGKRELEDDEMIEFKRALGDFISTDDVWSSRSLSLRTLGLSPSILSSTDLSLTQTPYITTNEMLQPGLPSYANALGVPTANVGMTMWFSAVILIAGAAALTLLGWAIGEAWAHFRRSRRDSQSMFFASPNWRERYSIAVRSIVTDVLLPVLVLPVSAISFYQWTIRHDAWLPDLLTALLVIGLWGTLLALAVRSILSRRRQWRKEASLDSSSEFDSWYFHYLPTSATACIIIPSLLLKSFFAGFAQSSGWVQVIALISIELIVLVSLITYTIFSRRHRRALSETHRHKRSVASKIFCCCSRSRSRTPRASESHALMITLSLFRLASFGILVAFQESLTVSHKIKPIPRLIIGIVAIVVLSVGVLIVVFMGLWELAKWAVRGLLGSRRRKSRGVEKMDG